MHEIYGRDSEIALLEEIIAAPKAEFLAVYGRRRAGKTFLLREFFQKRVAIYFEVTGEKDAPQTVQLHNFQTALERTLYSGRPIPRLRSWREALKTLASGLEAALTGYDDRRAVIFLDELPWMATRRSRLVQALDHVWNTQLSRMPQVILVVCGSAASWMIDNLIHAKGGLYNRVTRKIRLAPFTLPQTIGFLRSRGLPFGLRAAAEIYMAIGGVPHYLDQLRRGLSASQNIAHLCFSENGMLRTEFGLLFRALFGKSDSYEKLVRALARKRHGMTRGELLKLLRRKSGGTLQRKLKELEESGFIGRITPYAKKAKHAVYRIVDPYVYFYLSWIEEAPSGIFTGRGVKYWLEQTRTPRYSAWAGYTFENLCLIHVGLVEEALGLAHVASKAGCWSYAPPKGCDKEIGAQIDLLLDRSDGVVSLCEIKYCTGLFSVDKSYARELRNKIEVFSRITRNRKDVRLVLITFDGFKSTLWSEDVVDVALDAQTIFDPRGK